MALALNWEGTLTLDNIDDVADLLRRLLTDKRYTFVAANAFFDFLPKVQTSQYLRQSRQGPSILVEREENPPRGSIVVVDTTGVWSLHTTLAQRRPGYRDLSYQTPYLAFAWTKVTVTHRAPAGHKLYWIAAVEDQEDTP